LPQHFWKYWHTHGDTIDKINKTSLKAVGQTLLEVIFRHG
jgi:glutaminyl-peptide cyclotransferase